jgi:photosynthetic reaction center cytochrome c subunit
MIRCLSALTIALSAAAPALAQDDFEKRVAGKTAAEVNKNIQVLTTLPAIDLFPAMQFMAASLGVSCEYCHVTDDTGRWPMEKDDKAPKRTARDMLRMVQQINAASFGGTARVTCATCHHGSARPMALPPLFDAAAPPRLVPAAAIEDPLPTVAQVLDKFVGAIGGREANARITSRVYKGSVVSSAASQPLGFDVIEAAPDKLLVTATGAEGRTLQGVDGEEVWTRDPRFGVNRATGFEAIRMRRLADFHRNERLGELDTSLAVSGEQTINGRAAIVLEGTLPSAQVERLFFDRETGLLIRRVTLTPTALGRIPEQTDYEDYRSVGEVKLPFLVRRTGATFTNLQKYDEIKVNVPVDATIFKRPAS